MELCSNSNEDLRVRSGFYAWEWPAVDLVD